MQIRHPNLEDLASIVALEQANFQLEEQIAEEVLAYYVAEEWRTCLVMEDAGTIAGFLLALPSSSGVVTDEIFSRTRPASGQQTHLAIASLSISDRYQGQGIWTLLLAALKEIATADCYQGISLTCKDYLLSYYQMNQFTDLGVSQSQFGGQVWYDMYWKAL